MRRGARAKTPQTALVLFVFFVLVSIPGEAVTATGYVLFQCPMTGPSHLHLTKLDGHKLPRELVLLIPEEQFWGVVDPQEWYDYPGQDCSSGECEPAVHSRVQIVRISNSWRLPFRLPRRTRILGNFEVELRDGRKITGSFRARLPKPPKGAACA
jgi:hypothetical protein